MMKRQQLHLGVVLLVTAAMLGGCGFSRVRINESNRLIDLEKIQVGKTTFMETLREYGPPCPISLDQDARNNISRYHLRYTTVDYRTTRFSIAFWLILPFSWTSSNANYDTLIEFDDDGKVLHATQIKRDNIWRPLEKYDTLPAPEITIK